MGIIIQIRKGVEMLIILDPGHGGKDPGSIRPEIAEKDINLSIALVVKGQLVALGHKVVMTRNTDTFLRPSDRTTIANATDADLFVSIHCNGSPNPDAYGVETLCRPNDTKGLAAASLIQREVAGAAGATGVANRGVKPRADVWVVNHTRMPAVLVECGFVSNANDKAKLLDPVYRRMIGQAITSGIIHYFK
jgi:N-acetylmuramoyl-L-alanine amidase